MIRNLDRVGAGTTVLITGAGSGIGEALALASAARGARVMATDRRVEEAERVAAAIRARGGEAHVEPLDVRDADAFERAVSRTVSLFHEIDFFFNNAGIGVAGEVKDLSLDDWRAIVDVNVMGVVHGIHSVYPRMVRARHGHIINTASMAGLMPAPLTVSYAMTKSAVVGLSRSLRVEAATYGVRVTALCPGVIRTPILEGGAFGRMVNRPPQAVVDAMWARARPMDPARFANEVLDALPSNPNTLVVPRAWRVIDAINRASPEAGSHLARLGFRVMKREYEGS